LDRTSPGSFIALFNGCSFSYFSGDILALAIFRTMPGEGKCPVSLILIQGQAEPINQSRKGKAEKSKVNISTLKII
jgi:hypothetical protein